MKAWILFQDESGVSERPPIRRTWAPKGQTPVLYNSFSWKTFSLSAVVAYRWDGKKARLYFQTKTGSYETQSIISFLADLKPHFRRTKILLIWDGLPAHKSKIMQDWLRVQKNWLSTFRLPPYAPELNPTEYLWNHLKSYKLANHENELSQLLPIVRHTMSRASKRTPLILSFLNHAKLFF